MIVLLVSLARRAYHFQQLASSSTPFHECRTYYLKSGVTTGPIPLPGVIWNMTVNLENNAQEAAPNKSYSGLFSCLKNF